MALFDFLKKKKKEEKIEQTISLETPVFDHSIMENTPSETNQPTLKDSVIVANQDAPIENSVDHTRESLSFQNNQEVITPIEPLPTNSPIDSVNLNESSIVEPTPVFNPVEPPLQEESSPTVIEPISAETVTPENEAVTENTITPSTNPTPQVTEMNVVKEEPNDDDPKFCPNCGNMENGGTIICSNCGSRL